MLWLKGKLGSGKSTLMKALFSATEATEKNTGSITASFFFNCRGGGMEKSPFGLTRSLLRQILCKCPPLGVEIFRVFDKRAKRNIQNAKSPWTEEELAGFLRGILSQSKKRIDVFIDRLDECSEPLAREVVQFCREVTTRAYNAGNTVNICLASRHYPGIATTDCPEIMVDLEIKGDISTYSRLQLRAAVGNDTTLLEQLVSDVTTRSSGIFLWAVFAVALLTEARDKGKDLKIAAHSRRRVRQRA
jgi:hypothetical protein